MKKLFPLLLILLLPFLAKAQVPAVNDTTLITGSSPYTPQFRYVIYQGYRIPYIYNPLLGKYDFLVTGKYARAFYVPQSTTVAGFPLSGNVTLANLSNGIGIAGGTYNGSTARVLTVDTAVIGSKAYGLRYVPYDGATKNLSLGTRHLNANEGRFTGQINSPVIILGDNTFSTSTGNNWVVVQQPNVTYNKFFYNGTTQAGHSLMYTKDGNGVMSYDRLNGTETNRGIFNIAGALRLGGVTTGASGDSILVKKSDNLIYKRPYADFLTPAQAATIYAVINGGNTFTGDQVVNKTSGVNYYSVQAGTLGSFTGGNAAGYTGRAVSDAGGYYNPFIIQQYQAGTSAVFEINAGSNSGNYPMLFKAGSFNLGTIGNNIWNDNDLNRQKGLLNVFSTDGISAGQTDIFAGDLFAMPVGTQIRYCATSTTNAPTTAAGWVEQYYRDSNIRGLRYRDILGNIWINTTTAYPTWGAWVQVSTSSGSGVFALQSTAINTGYGINGGGDLSTTRNILADTTSTTGLVSKSNLSNALALYPRSTRNITTGYGINGGGNLTADRTLVADTTSATGLVSKGRLATNLTGYFKLSGGNTAAGTNSFTGALNIANGAVQSSYNTTDQTTNYERARQFWSGNIFQIATEIGGTGTARSLQLSTSTGSNLLIMSNTSAAGVFNFSRSTSTASSTLGVSSVVNASSGIQTGLADVRTINQSGTAGYRGLWISNFEQALGSGNKFLIDAGTNSLAGGGGTHTSKFTVDNTGVINSAALTASQAVFTDASKNLVSVTNTGTGNNVLSSSPSVSNIALTGSTNTLATPGTYVGSPTGIPNNTSVAAAISSYGANVFNITASRTFTSADFAGGNNSVIDIYVDCTGGNVTVTLPAPNTLVGTSWYITRIDGSANTVTIATSVSAIYGGTTLTTQYQSRQIMSNGSSWYNH